MIYLSALTSNFKCQKNNPHQKIIVSAATRSGIQIFHGKVIKLELDRSSDRAGDCPGASAAMGVSVRISRTLYDALRALKSASTLWNSRRYKRKEKWPLIFHSCLRHWRWLSGWTLSCPGWRNQSWIWALREIRRSRQRREGDHHRKFPSWQALIKEKNGRHLKDKKIVGCNLTGYVHNGRWNNFVDFDVVWRGAVESLGKVKLREIEPKIVTPWPDEQPRTVQILVVVSRVIRRLDLGVSATINVVYSATGSWKKRSESLSLTYTFFMLNAYQF